MPFNPLRAYRFRVEIDGIDQIAIQKFTPPEHGVGVIEHGGYDANIKTAGKPFYGNATIEKLKPINGADLFTFEWLQACIYGLPEAYKRTLIVKELGTDGITTINTWVLEGCFPVNISQTDLDRMSEDNSLETLELSVDKLTKF